MATQEIIDLDSVLGKPKVVQLDGKRYKLPADLPAPLFLKLAAGSADDFSAETVRELYEDVLALFRVHQPDMDDLPVGMVQMYTIIPRVYMGSDDADPPPKAAAGTRSTSRK